MLRLSVCVEPLSEQKRFAGSLVKGICNVAYASVRSLCPASLRHQLPGSSKLPFSIRSLLSLLCSD